MASTAIGTGVLWRGDTPPEAVGSFFADTRYSPTRYRFQTDVGTFEDIGGESGGAFSRVNTTIPAGNTVANTTDETAFASQVTIPANTLAAGSVLHLRLYGTYGTALVAPTLRGQVKLGALAVLNTGTLTTVAGVTNGGWFADAQIVFQTIGASADVDSQGHVSFSTAATTALSVHTPNTSVANVDTTASIVLSVSVTWGTAGAANTITLRQFFLQHVFGVAV